MARVVPEFLFRPFTVSPSALQDSQPDICLNPCNGTLTTGRGIAVNGSTSCARQVFPLTASCVSWLPAHMAAACCCPFSHARLLLLLPGFYGRSNCRPAIFPGQYAGVQSRHQSLTARAPVTYRAWELKWLAHSAVRPARHVSTRASSKAGCHAWVHCGAS